MMFGIHVQQTAYTAMMLYNVWVTCFCGELYFYVSNSIFPPMFAISRFFTIQPTVSKLGPKTALVMSLQMIATLGKSNS